MPAQRKVLVWFIASLLLTTGVLTLSGPSARWAAGIALLVIVLLMGSSLAIIGALFVVMCVVLYKRRRAATERPEWLPEIEPWPPVPPDGDDEDDEDDEEEEAVRALVETVRSKNGGFH
jgi:hypothetical protein